MSYGFLFIVGLLTGFHCIAMCGGFVIGFTARDAQENEKATLSPVIYGLGGFSNVAPVRASIAWIEAENVPPSGEITLTAPGL